MNNRTCKSKCIGIGRIAVLIMAGVMAAGCGQTEHARFNVQGSRTENIETSAGTDSSSGGSPCECYEIQVLTSEARLLCKPCIR